MPPFSQHTATLFVDISAIRHNWALLDMQSDRQCQTGAVIKADAYGLGMVPVSIGLYQEGCRQFYTARLHEAVTLANAFADKGFDEAQIIVFDGMMAGQEPLFSAHNLIPVINDEAQLARCRAYSATCDKPLDVMVHIDTAMARLGLNPHDWRALSQQADWHEGLNILTVMSHLASSDDKTASQNQTQLALFTELTKDIDAPLSLANSGGILLSHLFHFDAVRPGLTLFGLSPSAEEIELQSAMRLEADILQIRDVPKGTSVGYGASFVAPHDMRLATLGIGYADGFLRHYKDHVMPKIAGTPCPLVGRISMDSCVIDITSIADEDCESVRAAVIFDAAFTPHDLAKKTGTIAYEIMTTLGERLSRLYGE